jgi:hypothetical protein
MTTLEQIIQIIREEAQKLPDKRGSKGTTYSMEDILLSAFAVFYFQSGSWLNFQRNMQNQAGKNNASSLFGVEQIPSDNHIRDILDGIEVNKLQPIFDKIYTLLLKNNVLDEYQYFDKTLMVLLDGTYYHTSQKIHCPLCQTRTKKDKEGNEYVEYYHSAITPIVAHPKSKQILPLLPEMISNSDGNQKQDCEINASKRWLEKDHLLAKHYKLCILGDDLYCKTPLIEDIRTKRHNYIFVCKKSSHKKMYETIEYINKLGEMDTKEVTQLNKSRKKETYRYQYLNDVDLTGDKNSIKVNWCSVEVTDEKGKILYRGSFATDYRIDKHNVEKIVQAGRGRWKVENENNNTLKNQGYALEHNFGHGKEGLTQLLFALNILSFLLHTISLKQDKGYKQLYELINNRKSFFNHITTFTTFFYMLDWDTLWQLMIKGWIDGLHLHDIVKLE